MKKYTNGIKIDINIEKVHAKRNAYPERAINDQWSIKKQRKLRRVPVMALCFVS